MIKKTFIENNHIKTKQTSENYSGKNNFFKPGGSNYNQANLILY